MQNLTQKERSLLEDQAKHEQICIQKYSKYASQARDQVLRQMFTEFAQEEQNHYDTLQSFLSGSGMVQQGGSGTARQAGTTRGPGQNRDSAQGTRASEFQRGPEHGQWQAVSQEISREFMGPQGGHDSRQRTTLGGGAMGPQQTGGYANWDDEESIYRAPQNMEGRETMRQLGWATQNVNTEAGQIGGGGAGSGTPDEASMLTDMLMTEKYMSATYDTSIFESANPQLRQALQQIQHEEQKHGEGIFNYMQQKGMYRQS